MASLLYLSALNSAMIKKLLIGLTLTASIAVSAKETAVFVSFSQFMTAERQSYLEVYFSIAAATLDFTQTKNKTYQGGLEVTVQVMQDSNFVTGDRFRILSPEVSDTAELSRSLLHLSRFELNPGVYTVQLNISDINEPEEQYDFAPKIELRLSDQTSTVSDILFLESFRASDENSPYQRFGFEMIPLITAGSHFYPQQMEELKFYFELYNTDLALSKGETFLLRYYLENDETNTPLNQFAAVKKKQAQAVLPVLGQFNINILPSGSYNLVVEALSGDGEVLTQRKKFFYRQNQRAVTSVDDLLNRDLATSFVSDLGNLDSLYKFTQFLYPISTDKEQQFQQGLLAEADLKKLKRYFLSFWENRNPTDPGGQWQKYHKQVRIANRLYSTGMRPGYRSDRGRVFLTYGKPSQVDERRMEPNMPPYEIWHYTQINTPYVVPQNNRIFIFGEFDPSTGEYQLFHSTAIGELQSRDWRQDLYYRAYGGGGSIDPSSDPGSREFGSRRNQNIILNTTGADRNNR